MGQTTQYVPADSRAIVLPGAAADHTYSFSVQAFRRVHPDISATGVLKSGTALSSPYQPTVAPVFEGDITGTIQGRDSLQVVQNLENIASDAVLSTTEKPGVIIEFNRVTTQKDSLDAKAASLNDYQVERDAVAAAYTDLNTYLTSLTPAWNDTAVHTPIDPAAFQNKWAGLYVAIADLDAAITARKGDKGDAGAPGLNNHMVALYKRAAAAPAVPDNVTYWKFALNTIQGELDGWSLTVPPTDGTTNPVWTTTFLASSATDTASIQPADWTAPIQNFGGLAGLDDVDLLTQVTNKSLANLDAAARAELDDALTGVSSAADDGILTKAEKFATVIPSYRTLLARQRALLARGSAVGLLATTENDFLWSESVNNAAWTKVGVTISANVSTDPFNGASTVDKIIPGTTSGNQYALQDTPLVGGETYTDEYVVKADGYSIVQITTSNNMATGSFVNFDLNAGEVSFTSLYEGHGGHGIEPVGDGFYRIWFTGVGASTANGRMVLSVVPERNSTRLAAMAGDGAKGVLLARSHRYAGSKRLPYIKTEGSAVSQVGGPIPDAAVAAYNDYLDTLENAVPAWDDQTVDSTLVPADNAINDIGVWSQGGTSRVQNGKWYTLTDDSATAYEYTDSSHIANSGVKTYTGIMRFKKDAVGRATRVPLMRLHTSGGTVKTVEHLIDTATGDFSVGGEGGVLDGGDYWLLWGSFTTNADNTGVFIRFFPAVGTGLPTVYDGTLTGSVDVSDVQLFEGTIADLARTSFQSRLANYAGKLDDLQKAISEKDATLADWSGVGGAGKPADNATRNTGAFADLDSVPFNSTYITNRTADYLAETASRRWAAESGATVGARAGLNLRRSDNALVADEDVTVPGLSSTGQLTVGGVNYGSVTGSGLGVKALGFKDTADWNSDLANVPTQRIYRNLANNSTWVVGQNPTFGVGVDGGYWSGAGGNPANTIQVREGPFGSPEVMWEGISDGTGGAAAGFNHVFNVPSTNLPTRYTLYVWCSNAALTYYFGAKSDFSTADLENLDGTDNTNPYFKTGGFIPTSGKWYLLVGHVHPAGYTGGASAASGVYDPVTGRKLSSCIDFRMKAGLTEQVIRAYMYNDTVAGDIVRWARPRVDVLDGNEPPLESLMRPKVQLGNIFAEDGATPLGDADTRNSLQLWEQVGGTGRPADNATRNTGALADRDNVDWGSHVIGSGKPADNATRNTGALADRDATGGNSDSEVQGFNGTFDDWPNGAPRPTGWNDWSATTVVRSTDALSGRYSVEMTANGSEGIVRTGPITAPLPLGTVVAGSVRLKILSGWAGGSPGLLIDLYKSDGTGTYTRTYVNADRTKLDQWQTVPFVARIEDGKQIERVQIYVMGSYSGMSGGASTAGTVRFDSLTWDYIEPAFDNKAQAWTDVVDTTKPRAIRDSAFFTSGFLKAGEIYHSGGNKNLDTYFPEDIGSNRTQGHISAGFSGQAPAATDNTIESGATSDRITDTRSDNQSPAWYRTNYSMRKVTEFKQAASIGIPNGAYYGALETTVDWTGSSGGKVKQTFTWGGAASVHPRDGEVWRRVSTSETAWGAWKRDFSEFSKPHFNADLLESNGVTIATDANFKTSQGISSGFTGQTNAATAPDADVFNYRSEGGVTFIRQPEGGSASFGGNAVTGAIRIKLPQLFPSTMLRFQIDIFNYATHEMQTYIVAGYPYGSTVGWVNVSAQYVGAEVMSAPVSFGSRDGKACVWIGATSTVWHYPKIVVTNLTVGHSSTSPNMWKSGWEIAMDTVAPGNDNGSNNLSVVSKPHSGEAVFGETVKEVSGGAIATKGAYKTADGIAGGFTGQAPAATDNSIEAGADLTKSITGPAAITVKYESDGTTLAETLPKTISYKLQTATGSAVTSGVSWGVSVLSGAWSGTAASISGSGTGGLAINSGPAPEVVLQVKATYAGRTYSFPVVVKKDVAAPTSGGSGGGSGVGTSASDNSFFGVSSTSFQVQTGELTVTTGSSGTSVSLTAPLDLEPSGPTQNGSTNIEMKWQWWNGSSWVDVGALANSNPDPSASNAEGFWVSEYGMINCSASKTGLSANTSYKFRLLARRSSGAANTILLSGYATAEAA